MISFHAIKDLCWYNFLQFFFLKVYLKKCTHIMSYHVRVFPWHACKTVTCERRGSSGLGM